jgi:DNA-directed RNA polymerase beta subunit
MEEEWDNKVFPLLRTYFHEYDVGYLQKWSYDHFLTHRLYKIIEEEPRIQIHFRKNEFFQVEFGQIFVDRPYIVDEKRIIQYIMPSEAMLRDLTYSSVLSMNIFTRHFTMDDDGVQTLIEEKSYSKIPFARIPMMVGCSKCQSHSHCIPLHPAIRKNPVARMKGLQPERNQHTQLGRCPGLAHSPCLEAHFVLCTARAATRQ